MMKENVTMTYDTNGHVAFDEREIIELTIRACLAKLNRWRSASSSGTGFSRDI